VQEAAAYEGGDLALAQFDRDTAETLPTTFAVTAHPFTAPEMDRFARTDFLMLTSTREATASRRCQPEGDLIDARGDASYQR
jgi:hypothetical protein